VTRLLALVWPSLRPPDAEQAVFDAMLDRLDDLSPRIEAVDRGGALGDITGLGGFTHLAYYHGQVIARRLRGEDARADHTAVPRVTFTDPEVASVGLSEALAMERGLDVVVAGADPAEAARGYIHDFHGGALKLVADRKRGVLVGATMVTPRAGEILGELVLAVKMGTPVRDLADVIHPFPAFNRVLGAVLGDLASKLK